MSPSITEWNTLFDLAAHLLSLEHQDITVGTLVQQLSVEGMQSFFAQHHIQRDMEALITSFRHLTQANRRRKAEQYLERRRQWDVDV